MTRDPFLRRVFVLASLVAGLGVGPGAAEQGAGQQAAPAQTPTTTTPTSQPAVPITEADLDRIRKALDSSPSLKIDDSQLRFYVQILAKERSFAEYVKGYDLRNGPTKGGNPMSHAEFLAMVTPKEFYSSGGITAWEQLQFAVTNWLGQSLVKKAIEDLQQAKDEREVDEIRARIERELSALRRKPADPATPAPTPQTPPAPATPAPESGR
jgi:hypothetical protein